MRIPAALPLALLLALACPSPAQSTLADLQSRLVHQPLYLRIRTRDDSPHYDSSGALLGNFLPISFTLSGVDITSVSLKPDRLLLTGRRVGLEFKNNVPKRVDLELPDDIGNATHPETMHLEIAAPASGDYTQALNQIFVTNLAEIALNLPSYWEPFAKAHLAVPAAPSPAPDETTAKVGGGVKPPIMLKQQPPVFSLQARALRYSAHVIVTTVIGTNGLPTKLAIVSPAGLQLDEQALAAVVHYTFKPATRNGEPVPVQVNIDVNFQVF